MNHHDRDTLETPTSTISMRSIGTYRQKRQCHSIKTSNDQKEMSLGQNYIWVIKTDLMSGDFENLNDAIQISEGRVSDINQSPFQRKHNKIYLKFCRSGITWDNSVLSTYVPIFKLIVCVFHNSDAMSCMLEILQEKIHKDDQFSVICCLPYSIPYSWYVVQLLMIDISSTA